MIKVKAYSLRTGRGQSNKVTLIIQKNQVHNYGELGKAKHPGSL